MAFANAPLCSPVPPGSVVHCKKAKFDVYIGRSKTGNGDFGNPYRVTELGRPRALMLFEEYARARIATDAWYREQVRSLYGKTLGCWCAPQPCHGDILLRLAQELVNGQLP